MRRFLFLVFLMSFVPGFCMAQDIVFRPTELEWDYSADAMAILQANSGEFRMYCQSTAGVVVDPAQLVGQIAPPAQRWLLSWPTMPESGDIYCVATAVWTISGEAESESPPSNEWWGRIVNMTPGDLRRAVGMVEMLDDPLWMLREAGKAILTGE